MLVGPALAADAAPVVFKGAGPWDIDFSETTCSLRRKFAAGDQQAVLQIDAANPLLQIRLASAALPDPKRVGSTWVSFGPEDYGKTRIEFYSFGEMADTTRALLIGNLPIVPAWAAPYGSTRKVHLAWPKPSTEDVDRVLDAVRYMTVRQGGRALRIDHGSLRKPLAELDKCQKAKTAELEAELGNPTPKFPPIPATNIQTWLTEADFPEEARKKGESSHVALRLIVGADGKPASCKLLSQDGMEEYRITTCLKLMDRAKFTPAKNEAGEAVRGVYQTVVHWLL